MIHILKTDQAHITIIISTDKIFAIDQSFIVPRPTMLVINFKIKVVYITNQKQKQSRF